MSYVHFGKMKFLFFPIPLKTVGYKGIQIIEYKTIQNTIKSYNKKNTIKSYNKKHDKIVQ